MKNYCSKTLTTLVLSLILSASAFGGVMQTDRTKTPPAINGVMQTDATVSGTQIDEAGENTPGIQSAMDVVLELLHHVLTLF